MSVFEVLSVCQERAIQLKLDGERLTLVGNKSAIDERLVKLTRTHKAQLIELLKGRQEQRAGAAITALPAAARCEPQPASFNQQRLWFLQQLGSGAAYNGGLVLELRGMLNEAALQGALQQLVQRHETLRTRFIDVQGVPHQQVMPEVHLELQRVQLAPAAALDQMMTAAVAEPFDLAQAPLLRVRLYRLDAQRHVLLCATHHITADAWSLEILLRELCELYNAACQQRTAQLPALALQYLDYSCWERARLQGPLLQEKLAAWRTYLAAAPPLHSLPCDLPRSTAQQQEVGTLQQSLPIDLSVALQQLAAEQGTTVFAVVAAAYAATVARLGHCADVVLGTPVANRGSAELEGICGYFSNTAVLRLRSDDNPAGSELIGRMRDTLGQVLAQQDVPFDLVVDELGVRRTLGVTPVYQLWFSWRDEPAAAPQLDGLQLAVRNVEKALSRYDLKLEMQRAGAQLSARWEYNQGLFFESSIAGFADTFARMLQALVSKPRQRLWDIELQALPPGRVQAPRELPHVLEAWLARAAQDPDAPASKASERVLTFGVAHERSGRLAVLLEQLRLGQGARIAVMLEPGNEWLVALLAVWKLGAVYVPIEPTVSTARMREQLCMHGVSAILAAPDAAEVLSGSDAEVLLLEDVAAQSWLQEYAGEQPSRACRLAADAMYIDATGSVVTHAALARLVTDLAARLQLPRAASYACSRSPSGDWLRFVVVGLAGCVCTLPQDVSAARATIADTEVLYAAPSHLQSLWAGATPALPRTLLMVDAEETGGALSVVLRSMAAVRTARILAPSGAALGCLVHDEDDEPTCLGRAVGAVAALVMQDAACAPHGAWGELCFLDPSDAALQRTGWRTRLDAAGRCLRGGRIAQGAAALGVWPEVARLELLLRELPQVTAASATVRADGTLLACLLGASDAASLQQRLAAVVPSHLLPANLLMPPHLPLDAAGRLDWSALASAAMTAPAPARVATPTEQSLCEICSELLGKPIAAAADFFQQGGHSLLATRLLNRIRARLCPQVALTAIFHHPVLRELAAHIDARNRGMPQPQSTLLPLSAGAAAMGALSFAQQQLWLVDRIAHGSAHYNMLAAYRCHGTLRRAALVDSLQQLLARHRVLRTRFVEHGGAVEQQVCEDWTLPFTHCQLAALSAPGQAKELQALLESEAAHRFDLAAGLPLRITLVTVGPDEAVLVLNVHHIACDGWSVSVLMRELQLLYAARLTGATAQLPALDVQYLDYARWQRQLCEAQRFEPALAFWRTLLADAPPLHDLATDRPRPAVLDHAGALLVERLETERASQLQALAKRSGCTLFACLESMFGLFLARLSAANDIVIGTPLSGRYHAALEPLVGLFVNTIALRHRVPDDMSFMDYLAHTQSMIVQALAHQHCPLEAVLDALQVERSLACNPLFQIVFALGDEQSKRIELPGLAVQRIEQGSVGSKFDLMLTAVSDGEELRLQWQYATALFDRASIALLAARFRGFVAAILDAPQTPVARLPLLCEADRCIIDAVAAPLPAVRGDLYGCFMQQAELRPDAVAVQVGPRSSTYRELALAAEKVCAVLVGRGIEPGARVALYLSRSAEFITCVLGILRAGAAYVPLDTSYPLQRTQRILEDAQPACVITTAELAAQLAGLDVELLTTAELQRADACAVAPAVADGESLAYLMYTSGSTGTPKGVMVPQRAIARLVHDCSFMQLDSSTVMLLLAPVAFDASTLELWGPLLNGGRIVMYPHAELDPCELTRVLRQQRINALWLTAAVFEQWVGRLEAPLADLRQLLTGGDVVPPHAVRRLYDLMPELRIINGYGPTENTTFTCCYSIPRDWSAQQPIPIGSPIHGTGVEVLDARGERCPLGAVGELHATGHGLALGYWRNPVASSMAFLRTEQGALRYRTGDLVRYDRAGVLHYLGRADSQVKIRGHRVELGEIERCLRAVQGVQDVCVSQFGSERQLVAYFTRTVECALGTREQRELVRQYAVAQLPKVMVPAALVELAVLPITANGKLDRHALPAPAKEDFTILDYVAPLGELEQQLAVIWSRLLGFERIGALDDFFTLGGNSLLATRMTSALQAETGMHLPLREVFQCGSLRAMAQWLVTQAAPAAHVAIPSVARTGPLPVSYAQQRLWFIDQMGGGSSQYNMPALFEVQGALDRERLQQALDALVQRHEILRTTYREVDGVALQFVAPRLVQPLRYLDLSSCAAEERQARAALLLEEAAREPFDLRSGPVFRVLLLQLAPQVHQLLLNMHHIASDGWSIAVLIRDLMALYQSDAARLPPLPIQYGDFATWERRELSAERRAVLLEYWRAQLQGLAPLHALPTDRPRPARSTTHGATHGTRLDAASTARLLAVVQEQRVSLFTLLQAAYALLLARLGAERDVVLGTPVAGRERAELEELVGCFVNTLVLRNCVPERGAFTHYLAQAHAMVLDALEHQQLPFDALVEELKPARSASHLPLFQLWFVLQNMATTALELPELQIHELRRNEVAAKFDLMLSATEKDGGISFNWVYNTDLFDAATIQAWAESYHVLLGAISARPDTDVAQLPVLSASQAALLDEYAVSETLAGDARTLFAQFQRCAQQHPARTALRYGAGTLTYRELAVRAERLGGYLRELGVAPGERVGICCERSLELLIAVLGVWHAGAAFVPMDPKAPAARLAYVAEDTGTRLVLVSAAAAEHFDLSKLDVLLLSGAGADADWLQEFAGSEQASHPDGLAYVLYTSGTTGRPKGVMVTHASLSNLAAGLQQILGRQGCPAALRWAWNAPLVFDAALQALTQLAYGGELHLLAEAVRADPVRLLAYLGEHAIDLLDCTPSLLELLLAEARRQARSLPHLLVGGEPISPRLWQDIATLMQQSGRVALNVYGPTETTVDATWACIDAAVEPNIGRALPNAEVRVLDANAQQLPPGAIGECCIGGPGVALGYWNQPELTAERFTELRFSGAPRRAYRSGDLVRWNTHGDLIYLGRRDTQIKLRGYRIELAEIEQVILSVAGVTAAAVRPAPHTEFLVAYVVRPDATAHADIEAQCRRLLPEYMVPAAYVNLESLPLTANGKIDVRALPAPEVQRAAATLSMVDPTQRTLQLLWQRLLGCEAAPDDNFFVLGGHSLLAVRLISAIREQLEVEVPLAALFRHPTIAELGVIIDGQERTRSRPRIRAVDRSRGVPLSFAQHRLWLIDQMEGGSPQYNMPSAFHLQGVLDVEACRRSIEALVARHEILRTTYHEHAGQAQQHIGAQANVLLEISDLSNHPPQALWPAVHERVTADAARAFDLRQGVLRVELLVLGPRDHVLLFNLHHIASDGWSVTVLINEFVAAYAALSQNAEYSPAPLPIQYGDYASWQQQWRATGALQAGVAHWCEVLRDLPQVHSLPLDFARPGRQTYHGAQLTRTLSSDRVAALQQLALQTDTTLFMVLQTALAALLGRWSNEADIAIGTPVAGRDEQVLEPLIGFFLNTVVIRNDLSGNPSFAALLERTRRTVLAAFEQQHVPFEMLVEALRPERSLSHPPLFQVMLVLQNQEQSELQLPGLVLRAVERPSVVAKFDLLLNAKPVANGLELAWTYNTDLFAAATIERMVDGFEALLDGMAASLETRLQAAALLPPAELQRIVYDWNATALELPYQQCLHELFTARAAACPEAIAVVDADGALSYRELFQRAHAVAQALRPQLTTPEALVGVLLPKGRGQLIATLGIMMAGGAYLPLDTQWPQQRCQQILEHGCARALVTLRSLAQDWGLAIPRLCLDEISSAALEDIAAAGRACGVVDPQRLAYVIFTSGSTGTPKGVAIEHRSAVNTILDINQRYRVGATDSVLAVSALSFDLSVYDMFGLLAVGGRVIFPEESRQKDPAHWAELVERHGITLWDSVPASAELLASHHEYRQQRSSGLRLMMMSGDWIPPTLPRRLWSVFEGVELHSLGGATEGSIWSICYPILSDTSQRRSVPYGKPLANQSFHVLSADLEPCPVGVAGELFIGGIGVAREYYRDAERTAASFIRHPRFGTRLYHTGDVGRYLPDGNIEFIGRIDHQVKVRGFRIELGEIEAVLSAQPEIASAVVTVLRDPSNVQQLVAYLLLEDAATRSADAAAVLRRRLAAQLPSYMVPSYYVVLDRWPLSSNNKLDRKQLPPPPWRSVSAELQRPVDATEQVLLEIWQQVLQATQLGTEQNFFEAGGTSMHLIEIANRANFRLQLDLSVVSYFEHPTIASLARFIQQRSVKPQAATARREPGRLADRRARRK